MNHPKLSPADLDKRAAALQEQRERQARETSARAAELASLCAQPLFQRIMLGPTGYLTGLISDAESVLLSDTQTPVNDPVKMAVHLTRWRDARRLHADLASAATSPPATSV